MTKRHPIIAPALNILVRWVFRDPARPIEWIAVFGLGGWSLFLWSNPPVLDRDSYTGFGSLSAVSWAILMGSTSFIQIVAMLPAIKGRGTLRFVAMALASGLWTVIALNFWVSMTITTGGFMYTTIAVLSALTGIWLGWVSKAL